MEEIDMLPHQPSTAISMDITTLTTIQDITSNADSEKPNLAALFLLLIPVTTVFGNLLVVMSVYREKTLRTATNYLIISMASADLLVAICVMPFAVYVEVENGLWRLPKTLCTVYTATDVCASTASILNLVAISYDRYVAVSRPLEYSRSHRKNRRVLIAIVLVWSCSLVIALPMVTGLNRLDDTPYCEFTNAVFIIVSSFVSFFVPCLVMVSLYGVVLQKLRKRQSQIRSGRKFRYSRSTSMRRPNKFVSPSSADVTANTTVPKTADTGTTAGKNKKPKPVEKYVTAGVHNRFGLSLLWTSQQKVPVKQAIWHEYYPFYDMVDIAILVLNGTIKFNDKVQPICLPPPGDRVQDGTALTVAGWGHTQENGQLSDVLLQVEQPVVTNEGCMKVLKQQRVLDFMICAGGHQLGGRDSCQGDSGGPAVEPLDDGTRYVLQGVVSFGSGCARPGLPGAYTRVSKYVDWIYSKVQEHSMVYKSDPTSGDTGFWSAVPDITDAMEDDEDYLRAENTSTNATVSGQGTSLTGRLKGWLSGVGSMVSSLASAIYAGLPTDIFSEFTDGDIDIVE